MTRWNEKGVALVFTLFLMAALSAMAVSMMFLAQTETSASRNYKTMSQARYAGEAGVHRALHYLTSTTYTDTVHASGTTGFVTTVSPVTYNGNPVVLAPVAGSSNHPSTAIKDAYAALFSGTANQLSVGTGATISYTATATLLSMRAVAVYGSTTKVIQTWRIAATGTVPGVRPATVEVAALLERNTVPTEMYAIFATGKTCGAITLGGGGETDSYNSAIDPLPMGADGKPATTQADGSVGTNGNLSIGGQTEVHGNLDSPRSGVGNCSSGNVTALSTNGQASIHGNRIQLPQAKTYPDPASPVPPYVPGTGTLSISASTNSCTGLGVAFPDLCSAINGQITITKMTSATPLVWPNVQMSGGSKITINATFPVTINVNSWTLAGNSSIALGTAAGLKVAVNVVGAGITGDVIDFTGGSVTNGITYDPSRFQILYGGDQSIKLTGGTTSAMTVYAPDAEVTMGGGTDFYGSVLGKKVTANTQVKFHYDKNLGKLLPTLGQHVLSSFSWQKY
jgi:type IV pilus assembly PilX-like protein